MKKFDNRIFDYRLASPSVNIMWVSDRECNPLCVDCESSAITTASPRRAFNDTVI